MSSFTKASFTVGKIRVLRFFVITMDLCAAGMKDVFVSKGDAGSDTMLRKEDRICARDGDGGFSPDAPFTLAPGRSKLTCGGRGVRQRGAAERVR